MSIQTGGERMLDRMIWAGSTAVMTAGLAAGAVSADSPIGGNSSVKPNSGFSREVLYQIPEQYKILQTISWGSRFLSLIESSGSRHLITTDFSGNQYPSLRSLQQPDASLQSLAASVSNPNLIITGGISLSITRDGGASWNTAGYRGGEIKNISITPDNIYAFFEHRQNDRSHLARLSLSSGQITSVEGYDTIQARGFSWLSPIRFDQSSASYVQYGVPPTFPGDWQKPYYIIKYLTGQPARVQVRAINVERTLPVALYPDIEVNNRKETWLLRDNLPRQVLRIADDSKYVGTIRVGTELYPPAPQHPQEDKSLRLGGILPHINSVLVDKAKNIAFLGTAETRFYLSDNKIKLTENIPNIEMAPLNDPENIQKRKILSTNGSFPANGVIKHIEQIHTAKGTFLVVGVTDLTPRGNPTDNNGYYFTELPPDITGVLSWHKLSENPLTHRSFIPDIIQLR